jgi:Ser/Thr protein kinase RdoA (MazF antagonist)
VSELIAAVGLPPHTVAVAAGGRPGRSWKVITSDGPRLLRFAESPVAAASQLGAMSAAKDAGLPVPSVDRREGIGNGVAMLLGWMPGETIHEMLRRHPQSARVLGAVHGRRSAQASPGRGTRRSGPRDWLASRVAAREPVGADTLTSRLALAKISSSRATG